MSQRIYVVTAGEYSDYHIVAATTSKEKAEKIRESYDSTYDPVCCYGGAEIEEFEDAEEGEFLTWNVSFNFRGEVTLAALAYPTKQEEAVEVRGAYGMPGAYVVNVAVNARDREQAIKAAAERRAKALAEKEGL